MNQNALLQQAVDEAFKEEVKNLYRVLLQALAVSETSAQPEQAVARMRTGMNIAISAREDIENCMEKDTWLQ